MACGCAVLSTDCNSGPAEIITDGKDGVLVPVDDTEALATAMSRLMAEPGTRARLGAAAAASADRFRAEAIAGRWAALFAAVTGPSVTNRSGYADRAPAASER
jgi:glycosyltransferase involved in cell wall biosynthesis